MRFKTSGTHFKAPSFLYILKETPSYVGNHVPVIVYIDDGAHNLGFVIVYIRFYIPNGFYFGDHFPNNVQCAATGYMASDLNKHIQDREIAFNFIVNVDFHNSFGCNFAAQHAHDAIVGTDKEMVVQFHCNVLVFRTQFRINTYNVYGSLWKTAVGILNNISSLHDVERRNGVGDINNFKLREFTVNGSLYSARKVVFLTKIGS